MAGAFGVGKVKDNSWRKGIQAQQKEHRVKIAQERQEAYSKLTTKQKLAKLDAGKFAAKKQRSRLQKELNGSK